MSEKIMEMYKIKRKEFLSFSFNSIKVLDISAEIYKNVEVHTVTIGNRRLFWVRMYNVQNILGIKKYV